MIVHHPCRKIKAASGHKNAQFRHDALRGILRASVSQSRKGKKSAQDPMENRRGMRKKTRMKERSCSVQQRHNKRAPSDPADFAEKGECHDHAGCQTGEIDNRFQDRQPDAVSAGNGFDKKIVYLRVQVCFEEQSDGKRCQRHTEDEHRDPEPQSHASGRRGRWIEKRNLPP